MRVVWVTEEVPDETGRHGGGGIRQAHLLRAVAAVHPTTLVVAGELADAALRERLSKVEQVAAAPSAGGRAAATQVLLARRSPLEVVTHRRTRRAIGRVLDAVTTGADLVVLHHLTLAPLLARRGSGRWLLHQFHVPHVETRELAARTSDTRRRRLLERSAANAARLQRWAVARVDGLIAAAEGDVRPLLDGVANPPPVVVAPNGVDPERFALAPLPVAPRVVFAGTLHHPPNVDGVLWFVDDVWPSIRAALPEATLAVVGREPVAAVRARHRPERGVVVQADVADVRPHLAAARVAVVPTRFGTGTRLKVLEAYAAGRPVVSTANGVAGIGGPAIVEQGAGAMADAVVRLLADDSLSSSLGTAGRSFAAAHAWAGIGSSLAADLEGLAG